MSLPRNVRGIAAGLVFVMLLLIHLILSLELQYTITDSLPPLGTYLLAVIQPLLISKTSDLRALILHILIHAAMSADIMLTGI